jgi:hypothetical protein
MGQKPVGNQHRHRQNPEQEKDPDDSYPDDSYNERLLREQLKADWQRYQRKKGLLRLCLYFTAATIAMAMGIAFQLTAFQTIAVGTLGAVLVPVIFRR